VYLAAEITVDSGAWWTITRSSIQVASEIFDNLVKTCGLQKNYLVNIQVPGVEELKMSGFE
jgi:hypothetical protein